MILISQEEKAKNLELLKITVDELFNNSKCPKCYKKFNYIKQNSKYYKKSESVTYIEKFTSYGIYIYMGHTPCNSLITIRTDSNFYIKELYIHYSFYKKPYKVVDVNNIMIKNEDNEITFVNNIYYLKDYNINTSEPMYRKQVKQFIDNLIFE